MDLAIRQSLQRVLEQAIHEHALITIQCTDGRLLKVRCDLGSGLIDHSQKMTTAAMQMADMKVWAHRS